MLPFFLGLLPWTISLVYFLGLLPLDIALNTCAKRWVWRGIKDKQFREGVELPDSMAEGNAVRPLEAFGKSEGGNVPLDVLEGCNRVLERLWGVWLRDHTQGVGKPFCYPLSSPAMDPRFGKSQLNCVFVGMRLRWNRLRCILRLRSGNRVRRDEYPTFRLKWRQGGRRR